VKQIEGLGTTIDVVLVNGGWAWWVDPGWALMVGSSCT